MAEPAITVRAAHDSGSPNGPINRIVIHLTAGSAVYPTTALAPAAAGTAHYFTLAATPGSAHYVHDTGTAEQHCVPDNTVAWHAPPNPRSIGQEICGDPSWSRNEFLDARVAPALIHAAARTRELCDRFGVPKVKIDAGQLLAGARGVCGHVDVSNAWHQSTHWDPGPNFPWDFYMAQVAGGTPLPPPKVPGTPLVPAWPFGAQYVGDIAGPVAAHGGAYSWERPFIKIVQQWLVYLNCVVGIPSAAWPTTPWCDGLFSRPYSTNALVAFHQRYYRGQPYLDRLYADDWRRMVGSRP